MVRFEGPVWRADLLDAAVRRATVRLELSESRQVTCAELVLSNGDELEVLDSEDLDTHEHAGATLDTGARPAWTRCGGAWPPAACPWQLSYSATPAPGGTGVCGELRLWTLAHPGREPGDGQHS
ncbi:hypothetical protein [Cellulomonas denverensis]|uniref:Uncharacterized protein n=1 Tax=Cellulomonas denverensis TaxID=264297 RepID=A0A7X6KSJ2_9CELL|nr:hypothetical protein [Cellulomonas denverensis]NKY21496.1 hypothetical protein [Cellulomonas denverensis]